MKDLLEKVKEMNHKTLVTQTGEHFRGAMPNLECSLPKFSSKEAVQLLLIRKNGYGCILL